MVLLGAGDGDHVRAERVGDLHGGDADATGRSRDQHALIRFEVGLGHERVVRGGEGLRKAPGLIPTDVIGNEEQVFAGHEAVRRLRPAADDGAHPSSQQWFVHSFTDGADDTGEFHAGDVDGPALGRGVVAVTLHQVGGVDAGATDRDDDVEGARIRGLALVDFRVSPH